jgi:peptidyl-prolyl cis-trans isomerase D
MLQEIRERAQGWVAWAIVILISIPFAFWGIDSYFGGGADPVIATVDGTEITERAFNQNVNRARIQLRDQLGDAYDPALFSDARLRQEVLDRMIREALLLEQSTALGMRTSDQAIRAAILNEPAFQRDGVYSKEEYERVLRLQGLSPAAYEDLLRRQLLTTQLPRAIRDTAFVTDSLVERSARLVRQERVLAYVEVPSSAFQDGLSTPDEAAIQAYYDAHAESFATPEQVKIAYLLLDAKQLSLPDEEITEARLREQYQARLDDFTAPEERKVRHILLTVPADASAAKREEIRQRLQAVRERLLAGEPFATVAAEVSQDPGTAGNGGELGWIGRGALDSAFEQAVFALQPETLSEPVRSRFGYHLVEVLEVRGGEPKPFEAVRDKLVEDLSSGSLEAVFFEQAEQLATLTYESPDSLIPAAEALGLEVQTTDWIDRSGGEGLFADPRLIRAAFSEEVLVRGNNSEMLEPDPARLQAVVLRIAEHREPSVRPLEAVRDAMIERIQADEAAAAAQAKAEAIVEEARAGAALATAAGDFELVEVGQVERTASAVPPAVMELAFSIPRPTPEGPPRIASTEAEAGGSAYVVSVSEVIDGDPEAMDEDALARESRVLRRALANAAVDEVIASLKAQAKIERKPVVSEDPAY